MPYSKDPLKYPYEFEVFVRGLFGRSDVAVRINLPSAAEANSKRVQLQCYFKALEREAEKAEEKLRRMKKVGPVEEKAAQHLATKWAEMAGTGRQLMVRTVVAEGRYGVEITSRTAGRFGAALEQFVGGAAKVLGADSGRSPLLPAGEGKQMSLSEQQDAWANWMLTGLADGYGPLEDAKWIPGNDEANLRELAASLSSAEVLKDAAESLKQMTIVKSMLVMKRMQSARDSLSVGG